MKYTENYNLKKPEVTDSYNVDDFNNNADIVDTELKKHSSSISELNNPVFDIAETLAEPESGENYTTIFGKIKNAIKELIVHVANKSNPHNITLGQLGGAAASHTHELSDINGLKNSFTVLTNGVASNYTEIENIKTNMADIEERVGNLENSTVDELVDISSDFGNLEAEYLTDGVECNVSAYKKGNYVFGTIEISGSLNSFNIVFDINEKYAPTYDLTKVLPTYVVGMETDEDEPVLFNGFAVLNPDNISIIYTNNFYYTAILITFEYYLSM